MSGPNAVHEEAIWKQRLEEETRGASEWHHNWGFLANKPMPAPRGFSSSVAKYSSGGGQWTVSSVRVPDSSAEGMAAAESEQKARKVMSTLSWQTKVPEITKPCDAKGAYEGMTLVESDISGIKSREAALLMRTHKFQTLGVACRLQGLDPPEKYRCTLATSHEYGWRAPSSSNKMPSLEMFGVAEHAKRQLCAKFD